MVFKLLLIKLTKNMGTHDFGCALKHFALFTYHVQGGQVPKAPPRSPLWPWFDPRLKAKIELELCIF